MNLLRGLGLCDEVTGVSTSSPPGVIPDFVFILEIMLLLEDGGVWLWAL